MYTVRTKLHVVFMYSYCTVCAPFRRKHETSYTVLCNPLLELISVIVMLYNGRHVFIFPYNVSWRFYGISFDTSSSVETSFILPLLQSQNHFS